MITSYHSDQDHALLIFQKQTELPLSIVVNYTKLKEAKICFF